MANKSLFMPMSSKGSTLGRKKFDDGQFKNPPAYPDLSGFSGPSKIKDSDGTVMTLESSVSVRSGRV